MPLYEYECEACSHRFEKIQRFSDPLVQVCPSCGKGPVNKLLSAPAFQFKGTGWYVTDYASKKSDGASSSDSENKSDTKSDTKSETTSESKSETKSDGSSSSSNTSTPSGSTSSTAPSSSSSSDKK